MRNFTDADGRYWNVEVVIPTVRRVRERLQVELLEIVDVNGELFQRIAKDPCLLCDVLFVICQRQAESMQVTDEDFGRALRGDALELATEALLYAIADFFPNQRREILTSLLGKMKSLNTSAVEMIRKKLDQGTEEARQTIERELFGSASGPGGNASALPESLASIPIANRD